MTPLPTEFDGRADQKGYKFRVLKREGMVALLEKHNPAHKSGTKHYEVVLVLQTPKREFPDGRVVEPRESMPGSEKWGMCGWSLATLEAGLEKFRNLVALEQQPMEEAV